MEFETLEQVEALRDRVAVHNLSAPARFWETPPAILHRIYNGIGPDRWSARFRALTTALLEHFEEDALIHDWEYTFQPKTYLHFTLANLRFATNAVTGACARLGFLSRHFYFECLLSLLLAVLCQFGGWKGYKTTSPEEFEKCVN